MRQFIRSGVLALVATVGMAVHAQGALYYADNFNGSGLLHGTSPQTNVGGATWFANEGVDVNGEFADNAMILAGGVLGVEMRETDFNTSDGSAATLPITLSPNNTYTATVTIDPGDSGINEGWMYMSFVDKAEYSVILNGGGSFDDRPVALCLVTNGGSYHSYASWQDVAPFNNSGYAGDEGLPAMNGGEPRTLGIQIAVAADGSAAVAYFDNGVEVVRANPVNLTADHVQTIQGITIGRYVTSGTFEDFSLDVVGPPMGHPGDFDGDGDVDGADFVAWQTNFPTAEGATLAEGDADGDGDVDGADFVVWQTNFPFTPSPGITPVPEPASMILALGSIIALARLRLRVVVSRASLLESRRGSLAR